MAKLVVGKAEYLGVSSTAFFESEYEALVLGRAEFLFPEHHVVPFKRTVESETGRAKPDLALIDKRYRKWWVVEVELSHHPLGAHVLPQVDILANATYGADIAEYLGVQSSNLDITSLKDMMKGAQPQVLVIVNKAVPNWIQPLSQFGALLAILEVFRSDRNDHALRLNGDYPELPGDLVSNVRFDPHLPRLMIVDSPGAVEGTADRRLLIEFDGEITEWTRVATKDRVWLSPVKSNPLTVGRKYGLFKGEDGRLRLQTTR